MGNYKVGPNYVPSMMSYVPSKHHGWRGPNLWSISDVDRIKLATGMNIFAVTEERGAGTDRDQKSGSLGQQPVLKLFTPRLAG